MCAQNKQNIDEECTNDFHRSLLWTLANEIREFAC